MLKLGPELFELLNAKQRVGNMTPVTYGVPGISSAEIASIEAQLGFQLPADFAYLFQHLRDPGRVFFPWSNFNKQEYDDSIRWVLQGIEFDIDHHKFWMDRWGKRPPTLSTALDIARKDFEKWPKLLPIHSHRFLAAEPCRPGNPVFSIKQTDIICYGADLAHYLLNEFVDHDRVLHARGRRPAGERHKRRLLEEGKDEEAKVQLGLVLHGDPDLAKEIDQQWTNAYVSRGETLLKKNKDEEAKTQFGLALQRDPGSAKQIEKAWADRYIVRGTKLLDEGKDDEAKTQFDLARLRKLEGGSKADVLEAIAWQWFLHDKAAEGLGDAEQAVSLAAKDGSKRDTRGQIYLTLGRVDDGLSDLDLAIQYDYKKDAGTWYGRGRIYELQGKRELAIADYRHAISIDPGDDKYYKSAIDKARERLSALGAALLSPEAEFRRR
jgi:tetratricopeptide (TPR) repeat protein